MSTIASHSLLNIEYR